MPLHEIGTEVITLDPNDNVDMTILRSPGIFKQHFFIIIPIESNVICHHLSRYSLNKIFLTLLLCAVVFFHIYVCPSFLPIKPYLSIRFILIFQAIQTHSNTLLRILS